ncbi:MAG: peroxiredoxin [Rhodanobacteraceae bacterium]
MMETGDLAPSLAGTTGDNATIRLDDLRGQWVVVYFYPRDNTPGCTTEAKDFRDLYPQFQARNAQVLGVSRDSVKSHHGFSDKHELPFPLISDPEEIWCKAFDVIHEKKLYGKVALGVVRSTFLIDPEGKLSEIWRKVRVKEHAQAVLDSIPE